MRLTRLQKLAAIDWSGCCKISGVALADTDSVKDAQIEMLAGRPVLDLRGERRSYLIDLITGSAIERVSPAQAGAVAAAYATDARATAPRPATPRPPAPRLSGLIDYDQWTVSGSFDADRPLYLFRLNDVLRTQVYISSSTGKAVQITTGRERFWNWLGSVPHWLYFAELRHRPALWTDVLIATSLAGCFLAAIGIYIGVCQLAAQPAGRWSPYQGFNLWHHAAGLVFGVFALTWVLSGLLSMNSWGWLQGAATERERAQLRGGWEPSGAELKAALQALVDAHPSETESLELAPLNRRLYFVSSKPGGARQRLDAGALPASLNDEDLGYIAGALGGGTVPIVPKLMQREDTYYFSHHRDRVPLPVYRMMLEGDSGTRYYIDPVSGELLAKIDKSAKGYRWLHEGLHRMDFSAALRAHPTWDTLMLLLMSGVTLVCATGAYLGLRRLCRTRVQNRLS
jgi:hypothetical protein